MVNYTCKICTKSWIHKNDFTKHQNRKKPCISEIDTLKKEIVKLKMELSYYKNKKEPEIEKIPDFEPHGYEIFDNILSENEILQIFSYGPKMFDMIVERIYFNEKHTEHQNIYISNLSKKHVYFNEKKGCNWIISDSPVILDELKNSVLDFIKTKYNLFCNGLENNRFNEFDINPLKTKKYILKITYKMEDILERYDDTPENNKYFINKIIHILYNNKKTTLSTIKKYKTQNKLN
jgi:hypothetical protein